MKSIRTLFNTPIRDITKISHPHKVTFKEFIEKLNLNIPDKYSTGEKYPEQWAELLLAYNEIEQNE